MWSLLASVALLIGPVRADGGPGPAEIDAAIARATELAADDPAAAAEALEAVLPALPQDHRLHLWAGDLRLAAGDLAAAERWYQAAAAISGGDPASARGLAAVARARRPVTHAEAGALVTTWSGHPDVRGIAGGTARGSVRWAAGPSLDVAGAVGAERYEDLTPVPWGEGWLGLGWQRPAWGLEAVGVVVQTGESVLPGADGGTGPGPGGMMTTAALTTAALSTTALSTTALTTAGLDSGASSSQALASAWGGGLRARWSPWGHLLAEGSVARFTLRDVWRLGLSWESPALSLGPIDLTLVPGAATQRDSVSGAWTAFGHGTLGAAAGPLRLWGGGGGGEQEVPLVLGLRSFRSWPGATRWEAWAGLGLDLPTRRPLAVDLGWSIAPLEVPGLVPEEGFDVTSHAFSLTLSTALPSPRSPGGAP